MRSRTYRSPCFSFTLLVVAVASAAVGTTTASSQGAGVQRKVVAFAATSSGSGVVAAVNDDVGESACGVFMISPTSGRVAWRVGKLPRIGSLAVAPDGGTIAVGLVGIPDKDPGVIVLQTSSGKQVGALGFDEKLGFAPGVTYPRYGDGVEQLAFSPDGSLLYGLSNDTLFAWDMGAKKYLWIRDVPAVIEAPPDLADPLPYGHATTFALSPDGRQIAAARDTLRIATAGRSRPVHFITRGNDLALDPPARPAFSPDSRVLAAGDLNTAHGNGTPTYATEYWVGGALKSHKIPGCGGGIAWTDDPNVFGCQNETGAHLRDLRDPLKDIGAAGPVSDLPILKVGNSLWAAAYKRTDWKDPTKALALTLVELGTGKRVTVSLPGR